MEEAGKCRKKAEQQYYKPPKMVNKVNREGESVESGKMEEKVVPLNNSHDSNYSELNALDATKLAASPASSVEQKNRINCKKPEKQVYIPRGKANVQSGEDGGGGSRVDYNRQRRRSDRHKESSEEDNRSMMHERAGSSGRNHSYNKRNPDLSGMRPVDTISPLVFENSRFHKSRDHDKDTRSTKVNDNQHNTFPRGSKVQPSSTFRSNTKPPSKTENSDARSSTVESINISEANRGDESAIIARIRKFACAHMAAQQYSEGKVPPNPQPQPIQQQQPHSHSSHNVASSGPHIDRLTNTFPHNPQPSHQHQINSSKSLQQQQKQQNQLFRPSQNHDVKNKDKHDPVNYRSSWTMQDQRSSQSSYINDRSRNKKFNRGDQKTFEQNLPPRLQRKLAMEKANLQNRNSRQTPNPHNQNASAQDYYSNQATRGGIIRLPQESNSNDSQYFSSSSTDRHCNLMNESHSEYSRTESFFTNSGYQGDSKNWINSNQSNPSNNAVPRQLYDPCTTHKPCVIIRPTTHQPYQPNEQQPQSRCVLLPGLLPVSVSNTDHSGNNSVNPTNDSANAKNWSNSGNHQQYNNNNLQQHHHSHQSHENDHQRLPTSPPNVLVHYLPNYSSHANHQTEPAQRNQTASPQYDSSSNSTRRKLVEKNMNEIVDLANELQSHLKQYPSLDEKTVKTLRWKIQQRYQSIIVADPKFCAEHNVELSLWKSAFYQFIEMRRRELEENPDSETSKEELLKLTEEATIFFESLLVMLQDAFNFVVDNYIEHQYDPEKPGYEMIKLAAISAQKIYLYLGDLARYKEQAINGSNYGEAKSYYSKAQQIAPKNGRPYNQLALLAMYGRRRLDAVYNYMRSLAASNPFQSARESLLSIFEEVRKKYEAAESKRLSDRLVALKFSDSTSPQDEDFLVNNVFKERLEIWIRPDGTSSKHTSVMGNESEEEELDLLTDIDLNKRFVLSFLHVHGKLFTKTGLESFNSAVNQMLMELRCLLKRSPFPMSSQRLLQLMAISMFSVYQSSFIDGSYQSNVRSSLQEQSIQVILALVSLLLDRVDNSLKEHISKGSSSSSPQSSSNIVSDDVVEMLPAIKVWTDWMSCQKQFWSPPLSKPGFRIGARGDVWTLFAEVLTRLGDINTRQIKLLPTKFEGCEQVILPEDNMLSGFIPLLGAPSALSYVQPPFDKEKARTCLRISRIQFFGDYLCGIPEPYLEFDVGKKRFNSSVKILSDDESECGHNISLDLDDDLEDIPTDSSSGENVNCEEDDKKTDDPALKELWTKQETLRKAQKREEKIRQQLDAMLREETKIRLVIQPRFLIPDTNCFIHHLSKLQTLVECGHFEVIVPLIVINELNGLMSRITQPTSDSPLPLSIRETCDTDDREKEMKVGQAAKEAFDYLETSFNEKSNKLKTITFKGSLLNNMNFRNENFKVKRTNNDDLVLSSCLQFIKKRNSSKQTNPEDTDGIVNIFRETVLLTDDRNLRVKALSHNVPVKSLPVFLQFANLQ
ncbi:telomerase-binding protein EST1A isoform X3 [Tetranychus urticae]|uniref:telomerase-binding protein EST1A isoform X3 n=1 Tax=Tetranychus urticae TaxID=32264 RepID=UPI00077B9068|nr:telomerase-binding protein EST1A isoform X3 [Tetranychus urticae]